MSDVIDLDLLTPKSVTIKFAGKEIEVLPPKTANILRLGTLGQKISDIKNMPATEVEALVNDLTQEVYKCVPELSGKELSTAQLLKLIEIISDIGIPESDKRVSEASGSPKVPASS